MHYPAHGRPGYLISPLRGFALILRCVGLSYRALSGLNDFGRPAIDYASLWYYLQTSRFEFMTMAADQTTDAYGPLVIARGADGTVSVEGELNEANAPELERAFNDFITETGQMVRLDLSRLDIDDGAALVAALNALRRLRARSSGLVLAGAPQMLCHNLYRVGWLDGCGAIELVDMRQDEPAGF